jgi:hypothetical protein
LWKNETKNEDGICDDYKKEEVELNLNWFIVKIYKKPKCN